MLHNLLVVVNTIHRFLFLDNLNANLLQKHIIYLKELLEWLLDALHEDLNRVTEKPYSELKDSDGRADSVVAAEAWQQHHARNQSIVIDLFYGQLKSKVSCLGCGRDSVRFDPFSLLSLPLPVENYTYCEVLGM